MNLLPPVTRCVTAFSVSLVCVTASGSAVAGKSGSDAGSSDGFGGGVGDGLAVGVGVAVGAGVATGAGSAGDGATVGTGDGGRSGAVIAAAPTVTRRAEARQ